MRGCNTANNSKRNTPKSINKLGFGSTTPSIRLSQAGASVGLTYLSSIK
jgi:hypothetical protein